MGSGGVTDGPFWPAGTVIRWCYGGPGADFVTPVRVLSDGPEALVAWLPAGTPVLRMVRADGRELRAERAGAFTAPPGCRSPVPGATRRW